MSNSVKNIMIVGVGGQGTLLASKLLGYVLMQQDMILQKCQKFTQNEPTKPRMLLLMDLEIRYILQLLIKVRLIIFFHLRSLKC